MDEPSAKRKQWFDDFIQLVRARFSTLPDICQRLGYYAAFAITPCQLFVVTCKRPLESFAFVVHLRGVPDRTIWAYDPLDPPGLIQLLERSRDDAVFDTIIPEETGMRLPPPCPPTLRSYFDREMLNFLEQVRSGVFTPPSSGSGRGFASYLPVCQILRIYGDYIDEGPEETLKDWVKSDTEGPFAQFMEERRRRDQFKTRSEILEEGLRETADRERRMDWRGTFYYPPIRVGESPGLTLQGQLSGAVPRLALGDVVLEDSFGATPFWATFYGCLAVREVDTAKATRLLNILCGAMHLAGVSSYVV